MRYGQASAIYRRHRDQASSKERRLSYHPSTAVAEYWRCESATDIPRCRFSRTRLPSAPDSIVADDVPQPAQPTSPQLGLPPRLPGSWQCEREDAKGFYPLVPWCPTCASPSAESRIRSLERSVGDAFACRSPRSSRQLLLWFERFSKPFWSWLLRIRRWDRPRSKSDVCWRIWRGRPRSKPRRVGHQPRRLSRRRRAPSNVEPGECCA
jgi:hypothetical protein